MSRLIDHAFDLQLACRARLARGWCDWGRMALRDAYADLQQAAGGCVHCVLDGGAWKGKTMRRLLRLFPNATVHGVEPNPEAAARLQALFQHHPRAVIHETALCDANAQASLQITRNGASSSLLSVSSVAKNYHGERLQLEQRKTVSLARVDCLLPEPPQVIKLDVQGSELLALQGCGGMLRAVQALLVEVAFIQLYDGQPLFADLDSFLRHEGFKLHNLYELYTHPDGQLTAGDALYVRDNARRGR